MSANVPPQLTAQHCAVKVFAGASAVDSDAEDEDCCVQGVAGPQGEGDSSALLGIKGAKEVDENTLVYRGLDPVVLEPQDGAWVPVSRTSASETRVSCEVVLQLTGSPFEVAPGLWDTDGREGLVFVASVGVLDVTIAP